MQNSSENHEWFFQKHSITLIMWGLFAIIWFLLFSDSSKSSTHIFEKIDPYVLSTKWKTLIIRDKLITVEENAKESIFVGDKIKTLNSTATIFWPDGSITRLGEKSSISINEMRAKTASEGIQIDFSLEQGKSWSNVIKYMFDGSYFHERFNDNTSLATVRGTIFEINLDHKYIHTIDHAVSIEDTINHTGSIFVVAGWIFDTDTRKALLQEKIDEAWNIANSNADVIYLNEKMEALNKEILGYIGKTNYIDVFLQKLGIKKTNTSLESLINKDNSEFITQLTDIVKKWGDNKKLIDIYQSFYGLQNTKEILDTKTKLRDIIIKTAPESQKSMFINDFAQSTLYDSWNTIKIGTGSIEWLQKKLEEYIKQGADEGLINALQNAEKSKKIREMNNALENAKQTIIQTLGEKNLIDEAKKGINPENLEKLNNEMVKVRDGIMDGFKNLAQ